LLLNFKASFACSGKAVSPGMGKISKELAERTKYDPGNL